MKKKSPLLVAQSDIRDSEMVTSKQLLSYIYLPVKRMMLRTIYGLIFTLACAIATVAQTTTQFTSIPARSTEASTPPFLANEPHLQNGALAALYANSAFAHGYRHGYEEGFHIGDLDIHMGRFAQLTSSKQSRHRGHEYRLSFGSKALFDDGYQAGFHSGYADAVSGAEFRATERAKFAGAGLSEVLPTTRRAHFDEGVAAGFKSAQSQTASVAQMSAEYVERYCRLNLTNVYSLEYCSGFGRGYVLGSSRTSSDSNRIATARKTTR